MPGQLPPKKTLNLFAQELRNVLTRYNLSLSQLEERAGIGRAKVQRLLQSLQAPNMFPVLNVSEMELVRQKVGLDQWDLLHLRAALLATSTQKMLLESMSADEAFLAAEQLFSVILPVLQKQSGRFGVSRAIRGESDSSPAEDDEITVFFEDVWQIIDEAELTLHLSSNASTHSSRVEYARSAHTHFTDVQARLLAATRRLQRYQLWYDCQAVCQQGLAAASKRLEVLGE